MITSSQRIVWIDWMKTIAMYSIVAGHCGVPGNKYIYAFSVPCFFILSGFLSKRENDVLLFWKKLFWNLFAPMSIFFLINTMFQFAAKILNGSFELKFLYQAPLLAAIGMHGQNYAAGGLMVMWFVYTLIMCKILLQYIPASNQKVTLVVLSCVFLIIAKLLDLKGIVLYNSIVDTLLAMPFFTVGYLIKPYKDNLSSISIKWLPFLLIIGVIGVLLSGRYNDIVMLYRCSYGSNMILCIVGALCGTVGIYSISRMLERYLTGFASVMGAGTLVILGFHTIIIMILNRLIAIQGIWLYAESLLIFVAFYPVIEFTKKHVSVLYGKLRMPGDISHHAS